VLLGRAGQDNTPPEHYQTLVCIIWSLCFSVRHLFYVWNFLTACLVEFFSRTAGIPVFWAWLIVIRLINLDLNKLIVLSCEAQILSENAWQNSLRSIWLVTLWCDLWRIFNHLANGCGVICRSSVLWGSDIVRERSMEFVDLTRFVTWFREVTCEGYSTAWQTVVAWCVAVSCEAQTLSENARLLCSVIFVKMVLSGTPLN